MAILRKSVTDIRPRSVGIVNDGNHIPEGEGRRDDARRAEGRKMTIRRKILPALTRNVADKVDELPFFVLPLILANRSAKYRPYPRKKLVCFPGKVFHFFLLSFSFY